MAAKIPFNKDRSAKLPLDERAVIALEHMAHYLDRIESHLKKMTKTADDGGQPEVNGKVVAAPFWRQ